MHEHTEPFGNYSPLGSAEVDQVSPAGVRLRAGTATVEVTALAGDLFRVGMFIEGRVPDYVTEAIAKHDWDGTAEVRDSQSAVELHSPGAIARIELEPLRISFTDSSGWGFAEDDPHRGMGYFTPVDHNPFSARSGAPMRMYKRRGAGERYFGCGERTTGLEKTNTHQLFWNVDPPVGHTAGTKSLYTSIPFLMALRDGRAWGLFLDNSGRVEFDLAHEDNDSCYFHAAGGNFIYYVFAGPAPADVIDRYTELTGRTPMPPMWSLGNHQSRWSYETEDVVRDVARTCRERDIPCDVLHLDIDYMDGYRVFTWDKDRFPEPGKLMGELSDKGFRVVGIVDPGVKVDSNYPVYVEGRDRDLYCKTRFGDEFHNVVWPGTCAFPDFTNPETREWWGDNLRALTDEGMAGIWCDMNEPALFVPIGATMPDDVVHPGGGRAKHHAEVHNTYGSLMARAVREGIERLMPDKRPFVITRAGFAGLQRYGMQWTGDNSSWWEHLWMSMPQLGTLGLSGVAWAGVDIGGFWEDSNGELLARWTEFGVWQPFCRNHSAKGTPRQEPWAFGEPYESVCRKMLKLRQRLLPYLYTVFERCHRTGAPIFRPLLFDYPDDPVTYTQDDEFLVGDAILVAPIARPGIEHRAVYLPRGTWAHLWSGERFEGPAHILAHAPLGRPPIYVRANTAIPMWPEMSHVGERAPDPLTLVIYPAEGFGRGSLYEDSGEGHAYLEGDFARMEVACTTSAGRVRVEIGERTGAFIPERSFRRIELRALEARPSRVEADGTAVDFTYDEETETLSLELPESPEATTVQIA